MFWMLKPVRTNVLVDLLTQPPKASQAATLASGRECLLSTASLSDARTTLDSRDPTLRKSIKKRHLQ